MNTLEVNSTDGLSQRASANFLIGIYILGVIGFRVGHLPDVEFGLLVLLGVLIREVLTATAKISRGLVGRAFDTALRDQLRGKGLMTVLVLAYAGTVLLPHLAVLGYTTLLVTTFYKFLRAPETGFRPR